MRQLGRSVGDRARRADQAFRMVPLLEAGRDATWPWESTAN